MSGPKREPVRTCVGCRERAERRDLLRVVVRADGVMTPDPTGRAPGRGAYVHRDRGCMEAAIRRGALARSLRTGLDAGGAARLTEALRSAGPPHERTHDQHEPTDRTEQPEPTEQKDIDT